MARTRLQLVEQNLTKVCAFAAKAERRSQEGEAEVKSLQVQLEEARAAYVESPSDGLARAVAKKRETLELAQLRAQRAAQELQDALASVVAAESAWEQAKEEQATINREAEIKACKMTASIGRTDEHLDPLWIKLLDHYEGMIEAAQEIDASFMVSRSASETLRHEGVTCTEAIPLPPQYLYKYPTLERQKNSPIRNLVSDFAGNSTLQIPGHTGIIPNVEQVVKSPLLEFFLRSPVNDLPRWEAREEFLRAREYFDRRCQSKPPVVEVKPPFIVDYYWMEEPDPKGYRHEVKYERWSDGTKRRADDQSKSP